MFPILCPESWSPAGVTVPVTASLNPEQLAAVLAELAAARATADRLQRTVDAQGPAAISAAHRGATGVQSVGTGLQSVGAGLPGLSQAGHSIGQGIQQGASAGGDASRTLAIVAGVTVGVTVSAAMLKLYLDARRK